tara:strand:+ start:6974 stop:7507 length:534 start_codon:yes stop_codon:yes gene_type:complete
MINQLSTKLNIEKIESIKKTIFKTIDIGNLIMVGGNGGSASDAEHFCAELVVRYEFNRAPVKCISLNSNTTILTAASNDFGYQNSFKRTVECFGKKNDLLIVLSTSGNSKNIIESLKYANSNHINSIGFLGRDGGEALEFCDEYILINSNETALIQQCHMTIMHYLAMEVELYIKSR